MTSYLVGLVRVLPRYESPNSAHSSSLPSRSPTDAEAAQLH